MGTNRSTDGMDIVDYESFGAKGDGITDDLPAIREAHEFANANNLPVQSKPGVTYHLGYTSNTAVISTSTDWSTSRFTVDDSDLSRIESHAAPVFEIQPRERAIPLDVPPLRRDQSTTELHPPKDCYVRIEFADRRVYLRKGRNQNDGVPQHDSFILRSDGSIEGPIDWDYPSVSSVEAMPIPDEKLVLHGGVFTTIANRMRQDKGYNYWARNIRVRRSNTEIRGLTHYVTGETEFGHPYNGFLNIHRCADIVLRECFLSGHRIYETIGNAGVPVSMGSYDIVADDVVNFSMIECRMNHITDRSRWGVIGSNFCKNIVLDGCHLSRMDTHMGVSGGYQIRNSTLGHMGINAIGRGALVVENCTLYGPTVVSFRADYGSTWDGTLEIRSCRWTPSCGERVWPAMVGVQNDGTHDFGYPCSMPEEILVDGLEVDDRNHVEDYDGMYLLTNHDEESGTNRPFPYKPTRRIVLRNLKTRSGLEAKLSPNAAIRESVEVIAD